ncbi:MAG: ATP-dependent helicase [bacterium]
MSLKEETYNLVEEYNFFLKKINCLDFDDIILCINNIFTEREDIRKKVASKFKYIIVDEFQDINLTQFEFLKNLTKENKNIFVVGDDDQSIYAFRNACVQIMLEFPNHYPNTQIINLQYNYRSPEIIIKKYSKLISFNTLRYPKKIESIFSKQGKPKQGKFEIKILKTEEEEYNYISSIIKNYQNQNKSITILTRTNEICKSFEKNLLKNGINAKFISGYDFFQRKEIKDILSFLKVINNPADDISLIRILQNIFKLKKSEMKYLINQSSEENLINIISREKYEIFEIIQNFITENEKNSNPLEIIKKIYTSYIPKNNTTEIFINFAENFFKNNPELTLENFLNYILLIKSNNENKIDQNPQKVLIMTMHSCKGLEFDIVFVSRVNQGIIPHYKTSKEEEEEERRLLYVAMSRAKEALYITSTIPPSNFILPLIP